MQNINTTSALSKFMSLLEVSLSTRQGRPGTTDYLNCIKKKSQGCYLNLKFIYTVIFLVEFTAHYSRLMLLLFHSVAILVDIATIFVSNLYY